MLKKCSVMKSITNHITIIIIIIKSIIIMIFYINYYANIDMLLDQVYTRINKMLNNYVLRRYETDKIQKFFNFKVLNLKTCRYWSISKKQVSFHGNSITFLNCCL